MEDDLSSLSQDPYWRLGGECGTVEDPFLRWGTKR